jgi:hypothetical protein
MSQKYIVEQNFMYGWDDAGWLVDDKPMRFDSVEDAQAEIENHVFECLVEFGDGHTMASDFRIVPVT